MIREGGPPGSGDIPAPEGDRGEATAEGSHSPLGRFLRLTGLVEDGLLVVLLGAMIVFAVTQIVLRNLFSSGIVWGDAALRVAVLWVGLLGAVAATRDDKQITVDVLSRWLRPRWRAALRVVTDLFATVVAGGVAWHAARLVVDDRAAGSIAFQGVPLWLCELILPLAFGLISIRYAGFAIAHLRLALRTKGVGS